MMNTHKGNSQKRVAIDMLWEIENAFGGRLSANRRPWTLHSRLTDTLTTFAHKSVKRKLKFFVALSVLSASDEKFTKTNLFLLLPLSKRISCQTETIRKIKRIKFRWRVIKRKKKNVNKFLSFLASNFELKWKIRWKLHGSKSRFNQQNLLSFISFIYFPLTECLTYHYIMWTSFGNVAGFSHIKNTYWMGLKRTCAPREWNFTFFFFVTKRERKRDKKSKKEKCETFLISNSFEKGEQRYF